MSHDEPIRSISEFQNTINYVIVSKVIRINIDNVKKSSFTKLKNNNKDVTFPNCGVSIFKNSDDD
jgi:hypothetical protein